MFLPPLQASSPMAWRPRGASMCRQNILIPTREIDWNRCPCPVDGCVLGSAEMKCERKHTACDSCLYDNDVLIDTSPWWFTIYLCFIWHQSIRARRMWVHRMIYRRQKDECERYSQGQEKEKERCWCHKHLSEKEKRKDAASFLSEDRSAFGTVKKSWCSEKKRYVDTGPKAFTWFIFHLSQSESFIQFQIRLFRMTLFQLRCLHIRVQKNTA